MSTIEIDDQVARNYIEHRRARYGLGHATWPATGALEAAILKALPLRPEKEGWYEVSKKGFESELQVLWFHSDTQRFTVRPTGFSDAGRPVENFIVRRALS